MFISVSIRLICTLGFYLFKLSAGILSFFLPRIKLKLLDCVCVCECHGHCSNWTFSHGIEFKFQIDLRLPSPGAAAHRSQLCSTTVSSCAFYRVQSKSIRHVSRPTPADSRYTPCIGGAANRMYRWSEIHYPSEHPPFSFMWRAERSVCV